MPVQEKMSKAPIPKRIAGPITSLTSVLAGFTINLLAIDKPAVTGAKIFPMIPRRFTTPLSCLRPSRVRCALSARRASSKSAIAVEILRSEQLRMMAPFSGIEQYKSLAA